MATFFSQAELMHEALELPKRSFVPLPDSRVIERPGFLQIITPSLKTGGLNQVIYSVLEEAETERVIDETIAMYQQIGVRFRWTVLPESRPLDLAERLARRGLELVEVRAMYHPTGPMDMEESEDIRVEEVGAAKVDMFTETMAAGWGVDPAALLRFHREIIARPKGDYRLFLAFFQGQPAGGASFTSFSRSVYLVGGVVRKEFRGKGIYKALVNARLKRAAELGFLLATTQAQAKTSAPVLERLGFKTLCVFPVYGSAV